LIQDNKGQEIENIRDGVVMDLIKLENYLKKNQLILKSPIEIRQFKMGQSNPTFLIVDASKKTMVIRKRPPGELLAKSAHAIDREYRILYALGRSTQVPVPKVFHYCFDINIIGTEFYVMEFLKGRIFPDVQLPTVDLNAKHSYYKAIIEALVQLHSIDFSLIGLDNYGKKGNYYKRQIKSLFNISKKQGAVTGNDGIAVGDLNHLNEIVVWLHNNAVKDEFTLVHGDFKTDNIIFHPESNKVIGILDWELSTIGHPLSDLANLLLPWYVPSKWGKLGGLADLPRPLGIPEADVLIEQYCIARNISYPIPNWHFCIAFAFFRLAVITQGIAARVKRNQASSGIAEQIAKLFQPCAEKVYEISICNK
jgi:aminoglycoside phosphotransferase (APT) family kinase protein